MTNKSCLAQLVRTLTMYCQWVEGSILIHNIIIFFLNKDIRSLESLGIPGNGWEFLGSLGVPHAHSHGNFPIPRGFPPIPWESLGIPGNGCRNLSEAYYNLIPLGFPGNWWGRVKTSYSLRKHIGNALKLRSAAIWTAVFKYNIAAANLCPVRQELTWEEVVEYAFLADFNLLRDTRQDIHSWPWATPAACQAMDGYF